MPKPERFGGWKKFFMHKRPPFRYQKRFSCTKGRHFGIRKDFRAQKAAVSASKKIFMHKRPPFRYQKRFSCTKGRRFGIKKDFHAQKAAISASKKIFVHKRPQFEEQKRFLYRNDHLLVCKRWSSGVLCNETRELNLT